MFTEADDSNITPTDFKIKNISSDFYKSETDKSLKRTSIGYIKKQKANPTKAALKKYHKSNKILTQKVQ